MPGSDSYSVIITNIFHSGIFLLIWIFFFRALRLRFKAIGKGHKETQPAAIERKIRSFLLNVLFQRKLFLSPLRGLMHAFIFFAFLVYALHTLGQMLAGNLWSFFYGIGIDPYLFRLSNYLQFFDATSITLPSSLATFLAAPLATMTPYGFSLNLALTAFSGMTFLLLLFFYSRLPLEKGTGEPSANRQRIFLFLLALSLMPAMCSVLFSGTEQYELQLKIFSLLALFGLAFFAARRWLFRAASLDRPSPVSFIVISLISVLLLSTLFGSAAQQALDGSEHLDVISKIFFFAQMMPGPDDNFALLAVRNFSWWLHLGAVYLFLVYLPSTKHSHLFFAPLNFINISNRPRGALPLMDLEIEEGTFGAKFFSDLPQSRILDSFSCIECGRCTDVCPASRTGKALDPKLIMVGIREAANQSLTRKPAPDSSNTAPEISNAATAQNGSALFSGLHISEEALWACTTCFACAAVCPVGNNQPESIIEMRRNLCLEESRFPQELMGLFTNLENQGNPWGIGAHSRLEWAEGLGIKTIAENPEAEILYWVGCSASYDDRNKKVARSLVSLMQKAGVDFAVLGTEEKCTGDSARRAGNEYLYQMLAQGNIETLKRYNVKKIVTACPHCFNTLANEYPQLDGNFEVTHHSEYLNELIDSGRLKIDSANGAEEKENVQETPRKIVNTTYHDSCYLARYNGITSGPRELIKHSGDKVSDPKASGTNALCCGAGGARMWMEESAPKINDARTQQLLHKNPDRIATACPFCMTMITDGVKAAGMDEAVPIKDIAEILAEKL